MSFLILEREREFLDTVEIAQTFKKKNKLCYEYGSVGVMLTTRLVRELKNRLLNFYISGFAKYCKLTAILLL